MSNYRTQIEERLNAINNSLGGRNAIELELLGTIDKKTNLPLDNHGQPDYGTNGQLLRSRGNGATEWTEEGTPTDEQVEESVTEWLAAHPEATTTVENGSVTGLKLYPVGNGTDLQNQRQDASQSANAPYSFIAGGANNAINDWTERGSHARYSHVEGYSNRAFEWENHAEGSGCIVDGKIAHVEGNGSICSTNDGHAEGNRTVAGRRYYENVTTGAEDAGDSLGVLNYVLIPDAEGDVTSFFPNALIDNVTTRYGSGAQKDSVGNIYPSGMTPAVWDGDTLVQGKSLQWALHRICILRGAGENDIQYVTIAKCTYTSGVGTKVYYFGDNPTTGTMGIYSSYCPTLLGGGNGAHSEGLFSSSWGYGSHAEGYHTKAWSHYSHAEGRETTSLNEATHSEGYGTVASGYYSHAEGEDSIASGKDSHAEGRRSKALGDYSHCEGNANTASGETSHAEGEGNTASGRYSCAKGRENTASASFANVEGYCAVANRDYQKSWAVNKISEVGDVQRCELLVNSTADGVGWFNLNLITNVENGKAYDVDIDVLGRQVSGSDGTVGDTFAYNIKGLIAVASDGTATVLGTPTKTLIGRSSGMSGDGLSSGVRVALYSGVYPTGKAIALRYDGIANTKFQLISHVKWLEMKI